MTKDFIQDGLHIKSNCKKTWRSKIRFVYLQRKYKKIKRMYSLDCSYYTKSFSDVNDLINDIISSGMDPNYEITWNGIPTSEMASDFIVA